MSAGQLSTRGPWEWRKVGKRWLLWGAHGMRPIVLSWNRGELEVRDDLLVGGGSVLVRFDPEHPDARLIEAAPDLLAAAKKVHAAGVLLRDLIEDLEAAIAKAEAAAATSGAEGRRREGGQ